MLATAHDSELDRGATSVAPGTRAALRADAATLKPVDEMIRFVVGPDGDAVPDVKRKLPGRGIWITAHPRTRSTRRSSATSSRAASSATCASPPI